MSTVPRNLALGQAGVYRVLSELLLRGVNASVPIVDTGVDIVVGDGRRLQVKAGMLTSRRSKELTAPSLGPAYRFTLAVTSTTFGLRVARVRAGRAAHKTTRKYSTEVDFLVFWGVDEDRFWIVPAAICDGKHFLSFYPHRTTVVEQFNTYNGRLRREYEGRWDLLLPPAVADAPHLQVVGE